MFMKNITLFQKDYIYALDLRWNIDFKTSIYIKCKKWKVVRNLVTLFKDDSCFSDCFHVCKNETVNVK